MRTPDSETQVGAIARRIGSNVRRLRLERGWSHGKLAAEAKLARSLIWKIEQGAPRTTAAQLLPIAAALGVSIEDLARAPSKPRSGKKGRTRGRRVVPAPVAARVVHAVTVPGPELASKGT